MYKTSVLSDEISQDIRVAAALAREYHLDGLEIRSVNERTPYTMTKEDRKQILTVARDHGLVLCGVATQAFKCSLEDNIFYKNSIEGLKIAAELANELGAGIMRIFSFKHSGKSAETHEMLAEKMLPAIDIARDAGLILAIESELNACTVDMKGLADFLAYVDSPWLQALWDGGNEVAIPHAKAPYPDGYEALKPYICHVHLKDTKPTGDGFYEPALMGEGNVDYAGLIKRLKEDQYTGFVSVETHFRFAEEALDEETLRIPQGSGFSQGGEKATRAYLEILRDKYHWMD